MRKVVTICVCLPTELVEQLRSEAERIGISVSALVKIKLAGRGEVVTDAEIDT